MDNDYLLDINEFMDLWCLISGDCSDYHNVAKHWFETYDVDNSECIELLELQELYNHYIGNYGYGVGEFMVMYDLNNDACLNKEEFGELYADISQEGNDDDQNQVSEDDCSQEAIDIFENRDYNDDGKIDENEFAVTYYLLCQDCELTEEQLISAYDKDHD